MATTKQRKAGGRPSKFEQAKPNLLKAIADGNTYETACALSGITYSTFRNWVKAGEGKKSGIYFEFLQELKKAEAKAEADAVKTIKREGRRNWFAAAWFLERRNPQVWGRLDRKPETGAEGVGMLDQLSQVIQNSVKALEERERGNSEAGNETDNAGNAGQR